MAAVDVAFTMVVAKAETEEGLKSSETFPTRTAISPRHTPSIHGTKPSPEVLLKTNAVGICAWELGRDMTIRV